MRFVLHFVIVLLIFFQDIYPDKPKDLIEQMLLQNQEKIILIHDFGRSLNEPYRVDLDDDSLKLLLLEKNLTIEFGTREIKTKIMRLGKIIDYLNSHSQIAQTVDLDFVDKAIIKIGQFKSFNKETTL